MIDDDSPAGHAPLARTFDYLKHLTGISLVSIGGVLGLLKGEGPTLKPLAVVVVIATLALGGVISMALLAAIAALELKAEPERIAKVRTMLGWGQGAATFTIMLGLGIFLGAFVTVLNK